MSESSNISEAECDLVMKGGVTSGIVYPGALEVLSEHYRFRNIGGTSAGAIAATFAAAAEYGRQTRSASPAAGFRGLAAIGRWLGAGTNLQDLFQASPSTEPLMKLLLGILSIKNAPKSAAANVVRGVGALAGAVPRGFGIGAILGTILTLAFFLPLLRSQGPGQWYADRWLLLALIPAATLVFIGAVIGGVVEACILLFKRVPENAFGVCRGASVPGNRNPALTPWLNARLNELAGLPPDEVLTVGHLASNDIKLALVTTSLSHGRPYQLPLERRDWLFRKSDMEQYFPATVVNHIVAASRQSDRLIIGPEMSRDYFVMPEEKDFPLIMAARMSLSFPILFSAVPLYRPRFGGLRREGQAVHIEKPTDLDQCWFSDGGISSNFPVHFFDSWLPGRPTFGINLRGMPAKERERQKNARKEGKRYFVSDSERVFLAKPGKGTSGGEWAPVEGVFGLIGAAWNTAQNFRDNLQAGLPGYDERIAHIRLNNEEGGLNLTMPPEVVTAVQRYGREAGELIVEHFNMPYHQWTRMLMFLPLFEANLKKMAENLARAEYVKMRTTGGGEDAPYSREQPWVTAARERLEDLLKLVEQWKQRDEAWHTDRPQIPEDEIFFPNRCPKTPAGLRVVPNF